MCFSDSDNQNTGFHRWHSSSPLGVRPCNSTSRLGATAKSDGVEFVVFSAHATAVDLCLLTPEGERRLQMFGPTNGRWSIFVPDLKVGAHYGYRFYGPWDPNYGHFFNPAKLISDPYARALSHIPLHTPEIYAHEVNQDYEPTVWPPLASAVDSAGIAPWSVVIENDFEISPRPLTSPDKTIIYEAHVIGLTKLMPSVPAELRGTYAGLASEGCISYLKDLGITAVELLPVHAKWSEPFLSKRGLTNYWGYSTLNYFYPEPTYATKQAQQAGPKAVIDEFRGMVSILHQEGIEVILDVVYNHTCEGSQKGCSLSWRGADNATYYMQDLANPGHVVDVTGTGNSLNFSSPEVIGMTLDSLRYWVEEMGIDGFRFDLGVTCARMHGHFDRQHPFLVALANDPILSTCKLIMEPWDIGFDGWHTGDFPVPLAAWNDRFRSDVRDFWVSNYAALHDSAAQIGGQSGLATRLAGSADTFYRDPNGIVRSPLSSVNFITAHDGFTLADLVSFNSKHNEANGEENRDGSDDNRSWNHGFEGTFISLENSQLSDKQKEQIRANRLRTMKNLFATLLLSAGIPMFVAGDEIARSQQGNNNAYCQDSQISWIDWRTLPWQDNLRKMIKLLLRLREANPVMRPTKFATGSPARPDSLHADLEWFARDGRQMEGASWANVEGRVLQMHRCSTYPGQSDMLLVINGTPTDATLLAALPEGKRYYLAWDSTWETPADGGYGQSDDFPTSPSYCVKKEEIDIPADSIRVYISSK
ncbi:glycogen debranching protein GlgX [Actinomycetaceae bacterium TAE3-ERU4]|nr:glycogen debranching protein GlgX [Actinomycetaceae bacterium TAE3-ERU4]